jgi:hypothetical protein
MAQPTITLIGADQLIRILAKYGAQVVPALSASLMDEANEAFRLSQMQVPFRHGVLKASGRVTPPQVTAGHFISVELSYGGAARAYAYVTHEGVINGKKINFRNGKKSHYLSDPIQAVSIGLPMRLERRIQAILSATS